MTQAMHLILIIEDDPAIREILQVLLGPGGFRVIEAATAARGEIESRVRKPDLLIVDLGLPDGDGLTVIRSVRSWSPVPIIVLSARTMEEQKIAALDAGADDYMTKPFSAGELLARVRAALRRNVRADDQLPVLNFGPIRVDLNRRDASGPNGAVRLTPLEFRVLECMARNSGKIVMQTQIIREVWGPTHFGDTRSLRVCVKNLRSKLEPLPNRPRYLVTEAGLGYRLHQDEEGAYLPGQKRTF
jgi:two-component system, OmpR family, KDP operon response regulator KdpE